MHFVVTARITPFSPGASPPPVSIPTLRTSAIGSSFVQRCEKISLAKPLRENAGRSAERSVDRKGERGNTTDASVSPSGPPEEPVAVLGGFGVVLLSINLAWVILGLLKAALRSPRISSHGTCPVRLHGKHLPEPDLAGRLQERPATRG